MALRGTGALTVVLGVFHNAVLDKSVTLAITLWATQEAGQPSRFYSLAASDQSIAADFSNFGQDPAKLKKKLRTAGVTVHDSFEPYAAGKAGSSGRSFRFVVIDEAFGRGSDESARYGLQLFQRMKLQLLIVTPLQKIHLIEPFVSHVGFVANTRGDDSQLRNMTIQEYRDERDRRA